MDRFMDNKMNGTSRLSFYIIIFLLLGSLQVLSAQEKADSLILTFTLNDAVSLDRLTDARISVLDVRDSSLLAEGERIDIVSGSLSFKSDTYGARVSRKGKYLVHVEKEGYESSWETVEVPARQYGHPVTEWPVNILLYKVLTRKLGEVKVKASKILMVHKGDTLEYDATYFKLADGSMLDALIENLPGVQIDEYGRIKVNGEYVSSLLVNGREFFKGDPKVALRNLPSYTVRKVQVYRKPEGDSYLFREKPGTLITDPLVMDVRLKKEYEDSWIANAELAGGVESRKAGRGVYLGKLFLMRYTDVSSLAAFGNVNNLSDLSVADSKGNWRLPDPASGVVESQTGGISYGWNNKKGTILNSALKAEHRNTDRLSEDAGENFMENGNIFSRMRNRNYNENISLNWKNDFSLYRDRYALTIYNISMNYSHTDNRSLSRSASFNSFPYENYANAALDSLFDGPESTLLEESLVNRIERMRTGRQKDFVAKGNGSFSFKAFPWMKSAIGTSFSGEYGFKKEDDYLNENTVYGSLSDGSSGYELNQYSRLPERHFEYSFGTGIPLFKKSVPFGKVTDGKKNNLFIDLDLVYRFEDSYRSGKRTLYQLDSLESWTCPGYGGAFYDEVKNELEEFGGNLDQVIDLKNSYETTERNFSHQLQPKMRFQNLFVPDLYFYFNANVLFRNESVRDFRNEFVRNKRIRNISFDPQIIVQYRELYLTYYHQEMIPDLLYYLDVRDDSNPLFLTLGNSELENTVTDFWDISYRKSTTKFQRNFSIQNQFALYRNLVTQAIAYDRKTGKTVRKPINTDGAWINYFSGNYGQRLDAAGKWAFDAYTGYQITHTTDYFTDSGVLGEGRQQTLSHNWSNELRLTYRFDERTRVNAKAKADWQVVRNDRPDVEDIRATDFSYGVTLTTQLPGRLDLDTDLMMYSRRGYQDASMNDNSLVWNLSLARTFGKTKNWIVKASGMDLLHQISNVRRVINSYGRSETRYNTMPSYVMLHLIYRLDVKPKKK